MKGTARKHRVSHRGRGLLAVLSALAFAIVSLTAGGPAAATTGQPSTSGDRCHSDAVGNWSCTYNERLHFYRCGLAIVPRIVRWQVPEGTPPPGGWPVAFYYAGTQPTDHDHAFDRSRDERHGLGYEPQIIHELLDDPRNTGKRYAVIVPDPPASLGVMQAWHTNLVTPYSASCDATFLPDLFDGITEGAYGPAEHYDMSMRYAYGISSGGFNTSRMAVTFNDGAESGVWQALGIVAASYATCSVTCGPIPPLPDNHPPTRFWHGQGDLLAPPWTMRLYHDKLAQRGFTTEIQMNPAGHEYTADALGATGIKDWFDQH